MKRICFVGNSHVGAVKRAVDDLKDSGTFVGAEFSTYGSLRDTLKSAKVKDGTIFSNDSLVQENFHWTSGGSTKVCISNYDEICFLVGRSTFNFTNFQASSDIPAMSSALAEEVMNNVLNGWPMKLAKDTARENKNVQVTYIGEPFRSAEGPAEKLLLAKLHDPKSDFSNRIEKLRALMEKKSAEVSEGNFRVMKPPLAALEENGLFTQHVFSQVSYRPNEEMNWMHPPSPYAHMNRSYGRLLIDHLLA